MKQTVFTGLALSALASLASSQTYYTTGFGLGTYVNTVVRSSATATYGEIMIRIDNDRYRDWGVDADLPTVHDIRGLEVAFYDFVPTTTHTFGLLGYTESVATPDMPDTATPLWNVTGIPAPQTANGIIVLDIVPTTPWTAPLGADTFLSIEHGAPGTGGTNDALWVYYLRFPAATGLNTDAPGVRANSLATAVDRFMEYRTSAVAAAVSSNFGTPLIEALLDSVTGVACAVTNQTTQPNSNTPPGIAGFLSGSHPDARDPALNAGRVDNPGFYVQDDDLAGAPILFLFSGGYNSLGFPIFLNSNTPGSKGTFCLDITSTFFVAATGVGSAGVGEAWFNFNFPAGPGVRSGLAGADIKWQAIGINLVNFTLLGSPCASQRF